MGCISLHSCCSVFRTSIVPKLQYQSLHTCRALTLASITIVSICIPIKIASSLVVPAKIANSLIIYNKIPSSIAIPAKIASSLLIPVFRPPVPAVTKVPPLASSNQVVVVKHGGGRSKVVYTIGGSSTAGAKPAKPAKKKPVVQRKPAAGSPASAAAGANKTSVAGKLQPTLSPIAKVSPIAKTTQPVSTTPTNPPNHTCSKPSAKQRVAKAAQAPRRAVSTHALPCPQQRAAHVASAASAPDHAKVFSDYLY